MSYVYVTIKIYSPKPDAYNITWNFYKRIITMRNSPRVQFEYSSDLVAFRLFRRALFISLWRINWNVNAQQKGTVYTDTKLI